jgi:hypothetical protein
MNMSARRSLRLQAPRIRNGPAKVFVTGLRLCLAVCLLATALIIAAPLTPRMPIAGLDSSWAIAINKAVASHLAFGRDVIFTFGPYGGIYTQLFSPDTDVLMLSVGLFFALCFGAISLLVAMRSLGWGLCLLFLMAGQMFSRDIVFVTYPLLLVVAVGNAVYESVNQGRRLSHLENTLLILSLASLSLLPIIKGSFIIVWGAAITATVMLFLTIGSAILVAASIIIPTVALIVFWILAGESLVDLPLYFANMLPIITGYTEAMAISGDFREVIVYCAASAAVLYLIIRMQVAEVFKASLLIMFGAFLFTALKGGFVRHDAHAFLAAAAIIVAPVAIGVCIFKPKRYFSLFWVNLVAWFVIEAAYIHTIPEFIYQDALKTYDEAIVGIRERISGSVSQSFAQHMTAISNSVEFPKIDGTTDIYNYDQAYLLASKNTWQPRPILQSYSAYTPYLARLDQEHLAGRKAADNILFSLETIDGRLPSMDDGASWPTLLSRYEADKVLGNYLLLKRADAVADPPNPVILSGNARLSGSVPVPPGRLLFAHIDLKPTILGHIAILAYKTTPLRISIMLANGETRQFRIISGMASSEFLLSPLVENTQEFALLFSDPAALADNTVRSFRIDGDPALWRSDYQLTIRSLDLPIGRASQEVMRPYALNYEVPSGLTVTTDTEETCEGNIEKIDGHPIRTPIKISNLVTVEGWTTLSGKGGTIPDNVYLTFTDKDGHVAYATVWRVPREDVRSYFGREDMGNPGFVATVNVADIPGSLTLGLARQAEGKIELCKNLQVSVQR